MIEPTGSMARRRTSGRAGGGVLKADVLEQGEDRSELYTAAQAFSGTYTVTVKPALGTGRSAARRPSR